MTKVLGIHHVSAVASDPQRNLGFYAGTLGLRLVKRTVNFDDPQTYHLYYGDESGTPGTLMTFFPWPGARRGRQGTGQVAVTSFSITPASLGFWLERLVRRGVAHQGPARRAGGDDERVITFRDHDGLMLELVAHPDAAYREGWGDAPGIPAEHAIRGFHDVTLWVERGDPSEDVLVDTLGFRLVRDDEGTRRYSVGDGRPGEMVIVRAVGGFLKGVGGAGTVHHVAFSVEDGASQLAVRDRVRDAGLEPTLVRDRKYFQSVYFREPGGVLFELATDGPGFTVDEPLERLGESLMLPGQFEPHREAIEGSLPRIHLPVAPGTASVFADTTGPEDVSGDALGFVHRYVPPAEGSEVAAGTTLLLLHGTGGDEEDLIPLGRMLLPGAGMLSPRGNVLEGGAPRFFRRLAEGVFDLEDLAVRTGELAGFIEGSARAYELERDGIVAVGFSNGANMAASLLLRRAGVLRGAVLLSPMVPFEPETLPDLEGTPVFIGAGRADPIVPVEQVERLAELLREAGADVTVHWEPGGHTITRSEVDAAREWMAREIGARAGEGA
ncbi:MAG TPA: VOC family protein [Gemmatimonadales bacterium]